MFDAYVIQRGEMIESDWLNRPDELMDILQYRYGSSYLLAKMVQAHSIFEIGVNAGYTALVFLKAVHHTSKPKTYIGIDLNAGTDGGTKDFYKHAAKQLPQWADTVEIYIGNSHDLYSLIPSNPARNISQKFTPTIPLDRLLPIYDLVSVDGDHSADGCYQDTVLATYLAEPDTGWIIIDDVINLPVTVGKGVTKLAQDGIIEFGILTQDMGGQLLVPPSGWHRPSEAKSDPVFVRHLAHYLEKRDWTVYPRHFGLEHW